jgi:hypothetical protein
MWLVDNRVAERIKQYPRSALHIADDIGEMVLHETVMAEPKRNDYEVHSVSGHSVSFAGPVHVDISMTGVGVPVVTGNEQDDVMDYFRGDRHAVCLFDNGVHILWNIVGCSFGPVHAGLKHPETKKPVWYVPTMTLTCRKMEKISG